jgi:hypothetical protein
MIGLYPYWTMLCSPLLQQLVGMISFPTSGVAIYTAFFNSGVASVLFGAMYPTALQHIVLT